MKNYNNVVCLVFVLMKLNTWDMHALQIYQWQSRKRLTNKAAISEGSELKVGFIFPEMTILRNNIFHNLAAPTFPFGSPFLHRGKQ